MSSFIETVGDQINSKSQIIDVEKLERGRIFCIYFAASYCGFCRNFTPFLTEFYNQVNKNSDKGDILKNVYKRELEIFYVGLDQTSHAYYEFYNQTPFLHVPFDDPRIEKLKARYDIKQIPTLVVLRPSGELITKEGKNQVLMRDYPFAWEEWLKG